MLLRLQQPATCTGVQQRQGREEEVCFTSQTSSFSVLSLSRRRPFQIAYKGNDKHKLASLPVERKGKVITEFTESETETTHVPALKNASAERKSAVAPSVI
ncbi:hypothetical protein CRENBAI_009816 [Crenichthys baileyi]|uniref:Uncharacterized protein n=1 Tax=Crenichthys baileyi TaxID=28760 RepID=A0AAV9RUC8_9TELE